MADPTRPLPNLIPQKDGSWVGHSLLTPTSFNTRGLFTMPPSKVVPVIVVPGIMGSNLRAATSPKMKANKKITPGEAAWRPPNTTLEGLKAARLWSDRDPGTRQLILDGSTLEVDRRGDILLPDDARGHGISETEVRERYWGEVHWGSYGELLYGLYFGLNHTFETDPVSEVRVLRPHWKSVMECDPAKWGVRSIEKITEAELAKHADYYYPVYAFGYNWLESCAESARKLGERIDKIIAFWTKRQRKCEKVILVTHSMGGLVARACAKQMPDRIVGVIHGVMPALGAPACYRRIACGTESSRPGNNDPRAAAEAWGMATILGNQPRKTMAVMASSPGALELLPNHLYPQPWLHICMVSRVNNKDVAREVLHLPVGNPYDLYRDTQSWYRLIDPKLADPAGKYAGGEREVERVVQETVNRAEHFHRDVLGTYYHPQTYAFYGADPAYKSFGNVRWAARDPGNGTVFTEANLRKAARVDYAGNGGRHVRVEGKTPLYFVPAPQDVGGDGTVPAQSGAGPRGFVAQLFEMRGIDHQEAYKQETTLQLTEHLIVKLVQRLP
jgi:pimeloyl-ACP methyl ester carboxylesterase